MSHQPQVIVVCSCGLPGKSYHRNCGPTHCGTVREGYHAGDVFFMNSVGMDVVCCESMES